MADELGQSASLLQAGTIQHLEAALSAVCADFRADQYAKVTHIFPPVLAGGLCSMGSLNSHAKATQHAGRKQQAGADASAVHCLQ